jgi:hypothetical protein
MSTAKIVFTRVAGGDPWGSPPVVHGNAARAQVLTLPATSVAAVEGETLARVRADADGYVAIGPSVAHGSVTAPTDTPQAVHPIFADEWGEFLVSAGDKVAIVAAS